ncbi:MAG: hypothetical protein II955_04350 [Clostridia bacterium]|nr:hypothetical protein [Clostridia bacterium]MBQ3639730.1 hypothetical protein [Clostridia bacterium]
MAENRFPNLPRETVCIETNRVLDSCRDRDCFENVRVFLSDFGNEILDRAGAVRAKNAEVLWTNITIDPIAFNRGFYAVNIRFYVRVDCEACVGNGGHGSHGQSQDFEGLAVLEKRVILYGGENGTMTFRSNQSDSFCSFGNAEGSRNAPTAVVEVVDPVLLGSRVMERPERPCGCCCCHDGELPEALLAGLQAPVIFDDDDNRNRFLTVSLGIFSVIRIVRPAQYLIQASEYAIPEKECVSAEKDDPCHVFRSMPFPMGEFSSQGYQPEQLRPDRGHCGCGN